MHFSLPARPRWKALLLHKDYVLTAGRGYTNVVRTHTPYTQTMCCYEIINEVCTLEHGQRIERRVCALTPTPLVNSQPQEPSYSDIEPWKRRMGERKRELEISRFVGAA